jgi:hypothetical protein
MTEIAPLLQNFKKQAVRREVLKKNKPLFTNLRQLGPKSQNSEKWVSYQNLQQNGSIVAKL